MLSRRHLIASSACALAALGAAGPAVAAGAADIPPEMRPQRVRFQVDVPAGDVVLYRASRRLYVSLGGRDGIGYAVGVGREGRGWTGTLRVGRKAEWPSWTPTANMIRREPELYAKYAAGMPGGPGNPLGARALYLYRNGRDTLYRIHGTSQPSSIGRSTTSGCIRMFDADVIQLYDLVPVGARVVAY